MRRLSYISAAALACLIAFTGCGGRGTRRETVRKPAVRTFRTVKVPGMMTDPYERMSYIGTYYWDNFFADTTEGYLCDSLHIAGVPEETFEEQIGMFTTILGGLPDKNEAREDVAKLFDMVSAMQAREPESNIFSRINELMEKYLYNPNSPVRDEDIYGAWAERLSASSLVSEGMREAYARDARMCALNRVGTKAADFTFMDRNGRTHSLYGIKAPLTLLFFSNPGCSSCADIIDVLKSDSKVNEMIRTDELAVVNVYIDEEIDKWKAGVDEYPETWMNGYDPAFKIRTDLSYNVRAIPSLYLLDSAKTVLMKDAPTEKLMEWIANYDE